MRVVLADDHSIIRAALVHVVRDIDPAADVAEAATFAELEAVVGDGQAQATDIIVLDLNMPGFLGHSHIRRVVEAVAPCPVAVFSMTEDPAEIRAVMAEGVRAFIPKSTQHGILSGILRIVLAGGSYIPPEIGLGLGRDHTAPLAPPDGANHGAPPLPGPLQTLTTRQRQVMELLGEGLSNNDICERLGLNLSTVKAHVSGVLRTLGAESRTQAALKIRELLGRP